MFLEVPDFTDSESYLLDADLFLVVFAAGMVT
jgi:hypothetical protein